MYTFFLPETFFQCIQLLLRNVLVVLKLAFHIRDVSYLETWENKALYVYYADFIVEMTALTFDLIHHAHMLVSSPRFVQSQTLVWKCIVANGVRTFRPMQFQPLPIQPFTISTACNFIRSHFQLLAI